MSNNNLFRIGGIAIILGILLMFAGYAMPSLMWIGALFFAVFYYALFRFFGDKSPSLNLSGVVLGVGGSILWALTLFMNTTTGLLYNFASLAAFFLAPLFFGLLVYRNANLPRALAIFGIVAGVFGFLNFVIVTIAGGDYMNPNNPALTPMILATYYVGMLAGIVWLIWSAIVLLRKA